MAQRVIMPKQGLQMTEGVITKWLVEEGSPVKDGQPLFEMETDKLTIRIDANTSGTLLKILKAEGDSVPITTTIAIIGEPGEDFSALLSDDTAGSVSEGTADSRQPAAAADFDTSGPTERVLITPLAKGAAAERGIDIHAIKGTGPDGLIIRRDVPENTPIKKATPTAQRIAGLAGISMDGIAGSGENGKVMKADVLACMKDNETSEPEQTVLEISGMRRAISERMHTSLHTMAQANHRMRINMSEVVRLRDKLKESGKKVGFTDILIKVASEALVRFPIMNSSLIDNQIVLKNTVNMGLAVALEDGLIVPNIKNCHVLSLGQISAAVAELSQKAKTGRHTMDDYTGGTFTITNLGMYDVDEFTAIINPPEAAILAVGKISDTPVCVNKAVEIHPIMTLSLTYDHRIIDGAPAAEFLQYIKKLLENPYLLV